MARRVGCSLHHLRNLERDGAIPPATRTSSGYRAWSEVHVLSAAAYLDLARAVGPAPARELLRALHNQPPAVFLALLDAAHADLARQRHDLQLAVEAVVAIAAEPLVAPRPSDAMTISELAGALGITTATLRHWEAEALLTTHRTGAGRIRAYAPVQVRDARVIHQLRTAGYPIPQVRTVLRTLADPQPAGATVKTGLELRNQQLTNRSHALLRASAPLRDVLAAKSPAPAPPESGERHPDQFAVAVDPAAVR